MKRSRPRWSLAYVLFGIAAATILAGASLAKPDNETAKKPVTYAKQVSRILQNKCQTCHHPGTAAPFNLTTYDDVVKRADAIREVVSDKRMPPWHADPRYVKFGIDRHLTPD